MLVLALTVFGASPQLHDDLHHEQVPHGDDRCAVVLFAGGVALLTDSVAPTPPTLAWQSPAMAPAIRIFLVVPRYLRQPERGPPQVG